MWPNTNYYWPATNPYWPVDFWGDYLAAATFVTMPMTVYGPNPIMSVVGPNPNMNLGGT